MPTYKTTTAQNPANYGTVGKRVTKVLEIEVQIIEPIEMDDDVTAVKVTVNGRALSTMHPERAHRLGMVNNKDRSYLD